MNINNINKNKHVVLIELNSSYFFVFATNIKNKKNIKKDLRNIILK